ncbi:MAG: hypothetical protein PHO10_05200 [Gemmiger sp.]|nr:hypothetical protein [Gemmiger sp.]
MRFFEWTVGGKGLQTPPTGGPALAVTAVELAKIGLPARQLPRLLAELQRLVAADPTLNRRPTLLRLAKNLSWMFV